MLSFLKAMTLVDVLRAVLDIALVSYLFYRFFLLIRGTRAIPLLNGVIVVVLGSAASRWLDLTTLQWLLQYAVVAMVVGLPIVFQPELRRALEQVGRGRVFARSLFTLPEREVTRVIAAVVDAATSLARSRTGAIIVVERETGLGDIGETGIPIDAVVSEELLVNLFVPHTPLHDGAVIIRGDRVLAAGCFLPLTESRELGVQVGSRHRAALGVSEHSDAVAVVVSEETGAVSVAQGGKLIRQLDEDNLRKTLATMLAARDEGPGAFALFRQRTSGG